jgi:hypothetical protein
MIAEMLVQNHEPVVLGYVERLTHGFINDVADGSPELYGLTGGEIDADERH